MRTDKLLAQVIVLGSLLMYTPTPLHAQYGEETQEQKIKRLEEKVEALDSQLKQGIKVEKQFGFESGGGLLGLMFLGSAFDAMKGKKQDSSAAATYASLGIMSIVGAASYVARAADIPPTSSEKNRVFRKTEAYKGLVESFGKDKAENILMDINAGWTFDKLVEKYISNSPNATESLLAFVEENIKSSNLDLKKMHALLTKKFSAKISLKIIGEIVLGYSSEQIVDIYEDDLADIAEIFASVKKISLTPIAQESEAVNKSLKSSSQGSSISGPSSGAEKKEPLVIGTHN